MPNRITARMPATILADWSVAIEQCLETNRPAEAAALAQVVLRKLPRHLPTYQRLLQAAWQLRRWDEGEEWGRRLLRADPGNALAWRALAMAAEQREQRSEAHAIWQRALEAAPYAPELRAGLVRTSLRPLGEAAPVMADAPPVTLNLACLATLYLRGLHWERAIDTYRLLLEADGRRVDFQVGLMAALWQQRARQAAFRLAQQLTTNHPHLLLAWVVLGTLGDADDRALAQNPIATMDPDGDFVSSWFGAHYEAPPATLTVSEAEAALVQKYMQ